MPSVDESLWQPSASIQNLQCRAKILAHIRQFFAERDVMEVEVPLMSQCAVSDPYLDTIETRYADFVGAESYSLFLQTSPEYAMKRLLAAGSGPIYQLGKAFRNGESGSRRHNPEFTMLEWYRPGFDDQKLMDEIAALVSPLLEGAEVKRFSYATLFQRYLGIDPYTVSLDKLVEISHKHIEIDLQDDNRDTWLNLLMSHVIEPAIASEGAVFVYDYPASQAALAQVRENAEGQQVAARFELFVNGLELANGYHELTDAQEQKQRLLADQQTRSEQNLPQRPLDMRLVSALEAGIPDCAGVALGVDRLVMLAIGAETIQDVIAFPLERA